MKKLSCEQVNILLNYFIKNRLSKKIMSEIEYHLNTCQTCRDNYMELQRILTKNYEEIRDKICDENEIFSNSNNTFKEQEYQIFQENLSAYIDNELTDNENIRIRKIAIINPNARQDLEDILYFRQILQEAFKKTKTKLRKDYSGYTIEKLFKTKEQKSPKSLLNYTAINTTIISLIIITTIIIALK